mmetsp:Transcript_8003/g.29588  ORF Transcript_8003/g.29588 Transcript_8003/m.29588 type:complete len:674 (-) Transcript_8003:229-2250(-)
MDTISLRPGGTGLAFSLRPGGGSKFGLGGASLLGLTKPAPAADEPYDPDKPRVQYTREFLLQFKDGNKGAPLALQEADKDIVCIPTGSDEDNWRASRGAAMDDGASGKGKDGKEEPDWGKKAGAGKAATDVLAKASNPWVAGMTTDERAKVLKSVKGILNKLTPEKFDKLAQQMMDLQIEDGDILKGIIRSIFEKSVSEVTFCSMYADLCVLLSKKLPEFNSPDDDKPITFRRVLLNTCQEEFESINASRQKATEVQNDRERAEVLRKVKLRMMGNMRLVGELFLKKMVPEKIVHACIQALLGEKDNPIEDNIEALCMLLQITGKALEESQRSKQFLARYFLRLQELSKDAQISSRVRFAIKDVIDLKNSLWVPRREEMKATTIAEVHAEARKSLGLAPVVPQAAAPRPKLVEPDTDSDAVLFPATSSGKLPSSAPDLDGWETAGSRRKERSNRSKEAAQPLASLPKPRHGSVMKESALIGSGMKPKPAKKEVLPTIEMETEELPDDMRDDIEGVLRKLYKEGNVKEATKGMKELRLPKSYFAALVETMILLVIDLGDQKDYGLVSQLCQALVSDMRYENTAIGSGLYRVVSMLEDLLIDVPFAKTYLGQIMAEMIADGVLEFRYVYAACTASSEFAELGQATIQETMTSVEKKDAALAEKCRNTAQAFAAGA